MAGQADIKKAPIDMLLGLFNEQNGTAYTSETLKIHDDVDHTGERSSITVETLLDESDIRTATITYDPIPINELFSLTGIKLREVDIFDEAHQHDASKILAEINRKYGLYTDSENYVLDSIDGATVFSASATNPVYVGSVQVDYELSLHTRVSNKWLEGFTTDNHIAQMITKRDVRPYEVYGKQSTLIQTYFHNFEVPSLLEVDETTGKIKDLERLNAILATSYNLPPIPADWEVEVRRPSPAQGDRSDCDEVCIIMPTDDDFSPHVVYYFHYNTIKE